MSQESPFRQLWKNLMRQKFALSSLIVCAAFLLTAIFAEIYTGVCHSKGIEPV